MPDLNGTSETTALFEEILTSGLVLQVRATGRSMSPFLKGGEILTIQKVPGKSLCIGDLIFFKTKEGSPLLHRIVRKTLNGNTCFIQTKGDALLGFDEPVSEDSILGKVCSIEKGSLDGRIKHIDMESQFRRVINYLLALLSLSKWIVVSSIGQTSLYQSFRFVIKKALGNHSF